jgi:signal transduction histidine kinase/CheY-like chemotaxis protein/HPt (histidine-containing phosphotransfer) domain-containing protein
MDDISAKKIRELEEQLEEARGETEQLRRSLEQEIEHAHILTIKAEVANVAKSEFLASMSHEIRTPMNGVLGTMELLMETPLNELQREYAVMIQQSAQSLLGIINDILDFSKIEAGKLELVNEPFDLHQVFKVVHNMVAMRAREKGVEVRLEYPEDVPRFYSGDAGRVRQILLNLAGNAVKFTEQGYVCLRACARDRGIRLEVEDTGVGIPEELHEEIFDQFSRVDDEKSRRIEGSGLGLAISSKLTHMMDGEISLESTCGVGTTFRVELPLERADAATEAPEPSGTEEATAAARYPYRILLVEDNALNQKLGRHMLGSLGCTVDIVENGIQALQAMGMNPADLEDSSGADRYSGYDLVFMDGNMPEMDGLEAASLIRAIEGNWARRGIIAEGCRLPVVAMTAMALAGDREDCLDAGMDDYIAKPIAKKEIRRVFERLLRSGERTPSTVPVSEPPEDTAAGGFTLDWLREVAENDQDLIEELLSDFCRDTPGYVAALENAMDMRDADAVMHAAHKLAGCAAYIGASELSEAARQIETMVRTKASVDCDRELALLKHRHVTLIDTIQGMMKDGF